LTGLTNPRVGLEKFGAATDRSTSPTDRSVSGLLRGRSSLWELVFPRQKRHVDVALLLFAYVVIRGPYGSAWADPPSLAFVAHLIEVAIVALVFFGVFRGGWL
jgi:hypothetical protein